MIEAVKKLSSIGFIISLDDFGTGYSNLEWLSILEPGEIKIDKMFTKSVNTNSINELTLNGMLHMLEHINIKMVFEGIETIEQMNFINENLPMSIGQGWLFSKPIKYDDLELEISRIESNLGCNHS